MFAGGIASWRSSAFDSASGSIASYTTSQSVAASSLHGSVPVSIQQGFITQGWATGTSIDESTYLKFSLVHDSSTSRLKPLTFDLHYASSAMPLIDWAIRTSRDNYTETFNLKTESVRDYLEIDISGLSWIEKGEEIEFRIYGFDAETSNTIIQFDNFELVAPPFPVPEPSIVHFITLGFLALLAYGIRGLTRRCSQPLAASLSGLADDQIADDHNQ